MVQSHQQPTKARHFVLNEVTLAAVRLSENFTRQVADEAAIAREVKRQMGTWGPRELVQVFWGSAVEQMYYVYNQTISEHWGLEYKYVSPKRFIRTAAHALLCQEVALLLRERGFFQTVWDKRAATS